MESRRQFLQKIAITAPTLLVANRLMAQIPDTINPGIGPYPDAWLPDGIRSRFVDDVNGLRQAIASRGEAAKTAYRTGYFAVRDRLADVNNEIATATDATKRSRLERDRNRISYYVEMDYDAPEAYLRTGLDR